MSTTYIGTVQSRYVLLPTQAEYHVMRGDPAPFAAATVGRVALPEMRRYGYEASFATATLAAGGTLGILIPPSVLLIVVDTLRADAIAGFGGDPSASPRTTSELAARGAVTLISAESLLRRPP